MAASATESLRRRRRPGAPLSGGAKAAASRGFSATDRAVDPHDHARAVLAVRRPRLAAVELRDQADHVQAQPQMRLLIARVMLLAIEVMGAQGNQRFEEAPGHLRGKQGSAVADGERAFFESMVSL